MNRKGTWLTLTTAGLILAALGLAAAFLFIGPDRVEQQSIELFQDQQRVIAEQGAQRIAESLNNIRGRVRVESLRMHEQLRQLPPGEKLREALARLRYPQDERFGLTMLVFNTEGRILASYPPDALDRDFQPKPLRPEPETEAFLYCETCLGHGGTLALTEQLRGERAMAVNIDLTTFVASIFQSVIEATASHAALIGPEGRILYASGQGPGPDVHEPFVTATAPVPGTDWHVRVSAPRRAIAPEIGQAVTTLLAVTYGIIAILLLGLGLFGYVEWKSYSNRLERLRRMAQQNKLATLGMMAASTSHEINNALSAAKYRIEIARRQADPDLDEHLEAVAGSVDRLADLSNNLSSYASQRQDRFENFSLQSALQDALEVVAPRVEAGTKLEVEREVDPTIHGAPHSITQVFVNLILNALEAVADQPDKKIAIELQRDQHHAIATVTDNGEGIPPEIIDEIFDPFVTSKEETGGTGIGLWLSEQIVEQHDGTIEATNTEQGGARFAIRLPIAPSDDGSSDDATADQIDD